MKTDFKWINFPPHSHGCCLDEKLNFNSLLFSFSRAIFCFVIAPGTANRTISGWQDLFKFIHVKIGNWKKSNFFCVTTFLSLVVMWKNSTLFLNCFIIIIKTLLHVLYLQLLSTPILTSHHPSTSWTSILYVEIFFISNCDIWFMQIYFIARIFSTFPATTTMMMILLLLRIDKGNRLRTWPWLIKRVDDVKCKREIQKAAINMQIKRCKRQ